MEQLKVNDEVLIIAEDGFNGKTGVIIEIRTNRFYKYLVLIKNTGKYGFAESELQKLPKNTSNETKILSESKKNFTKIGTDIGKFTDEKNLQYGSSVDATYKMMQILLERYTYDDEQYLIPKELVKHMLLQVRMMDKQNRIFNNPTGNKDDESQYHDLAGYSLIGIDMVKGGDSE
ncbi:hypothetical protein [Psychrobacillus phage Perkons]|nr:hypothetical protein [Psychrobacillus phage Perkons]